MSPIESRRELESAAGARVLERLDLDGPGGILADVVDRDARVAGIAGVKARGVLVQGQPANPVARIGHATEENQFTRIPVLIDPDPVDGDETDVEKLPRRMYRKAQRKGRRTCSGEQRRRAAAGRLRL